MKNIMKLAYCLGDCPPSWRNFIHQIQVSPDDVPLQVIQHELSKFGARYVESASLYRIPDHVEFDSVKQLTWFTLMWS